MECFRLINGMFNYDVGTCWKLIPPLYTFCMDYQ